MLARILVDFFRVLLVAFIRLRLFLARIFLLLLYASMICFCGNFDKFLPWRKFVKLEEQNINISKYIRRTEDLPHYTRE